MIELKNVTKKYGDFKAVDDVSFKIEKGEIIGFLGENGAGKTTTMKLITGLIESDEGQILIDGKELSKKSRKMIGYMPENTPLYNDLTVKEFINYMAELKMIKRNERKQEVERLISELDLKSVEKKLIRNISRGYKQRVSFAGALVGNPEILILDEPTVGLDPKQIIEIRNLIKSLRRKHTVFLSSHILSEINQICKKIIIIHKGKIVAMDSPENLSGKMENKSLCITVEDEHNKMENIKNIIPEITDIKYIKTIENNVIQYEIIIDSNKDIRKELSKKLIENDITIIELKKSDDSFEKAFLDIIDSDEEKGK